MITSLATLGFLKFMTASEAALAILPENGLTAFGLGLVTNPHFAAASGFDADVKDELNPVIKGFVYIMYALTLVFVILGIMKARSEDKASAMWYMILAALIGIMGLVVRNVFSKVATETQINF